MHSHRFISKSSNSRGQIALEFMILTATSLLFMFVLLIVLGKISADNNEVQKNKALQDLGTSIQQELSSASEMEYGYHRPLELPSKVEGQEYNITIETGGSGNSYLVIASGKSEFLYQVPETTGTLSPGRNIIIKEDTLIAGPST